MLLNTKRVTAACSFFFFNDTATTEIYTLSLHDALPIFFAGAGPQSRAFVSPAVTSSAGVPYSTESTVMLPRSEEHTSELQSQSNLVCRLLLEKKKKEKRNGIGTNA